MAVELRFMSTTNIPASPVFDISGAGAVLDLSSNSGTLSLSGQTVRGLGTIWGALNTSSGANTVFVGETNVIGTLTATNGVVLGGSTTTFMKLSAAPLTNDVLSGGTPGITLA